MIKYISKAYGLNGLIAILCVQAVSSVCLGDITSLPKAIDFGRTSKDEIVTSSIKITNRGNNTIEITAVRGDCSCTVADTGSKILKAGQSTDLTVRLKTSDLGLGNISRIVSVETTGGALRVPITATVCQNKNWEITSLPLFLGDGAVANEQSGRISVTCLKGSYRILGVAGSTPWISGTLEEREGGNYYLIVTRKAGAQAGLMSASLTIKTNDPEAEKIDVPVYAVVHAGIYISPNPLVVRTGRGVATETKTIELGGWTGPDIPTLSVDKGETKLLRVSNGTATYELQLTIDNAGSTVRQLKLHAAGVQLATFPVFLRPD